MRPHNPTIPLAHEYIGTIDEAIRDMHIQSTLLAVLELLEQFEVARSDDDFACGESLHLFVA